MPWVRIPVGPWLRNETGSLKWYPALVPVPRDAPSRVKRGWEELTPPARRQVWRMRLYVRAIQALTGPVHRGPDYINSTISSWLLCHVVNSSARVPMKDVPSCDKPRGPAWRGRTEDFRMGIPLTIALRNRERPELKHLSMDRKRNRMGCR